MEALAGTWLQRGADGFRLDATRHLIEDGPGDLQVDTPETHAHLKEFSAYVRGAKPQAVLVGENWTDTQGIARYFGSTAVIAGGDELPMNFDFPLAGAIVAGVRDGRAAGVVGTLAQILSLYPPGVNDAPFLTNHDMVRIATGLNGETAKLRLAASILLTLPGSPFLYYGEEIGLANGTTDNDEAKRTPMPWDGTPGGGFTTAAPWIAFSTGHETVNVAAETGDPGSLLSYYRTLLRSRATSTALRGGAIELLAAPDADPGLLAYLRVAADERVLVVHNLSARTVTAGPYSVRGTLIETVCACGNPPVPQGGAGAWAVEMPPLSSGVWRFR
jgi:alpha-amylase